MVPDPVVDDPFVLEAVPETPLPASPLKAVLFQVRFPASILHAKVALESAEFGEDITKEYPFRDTGQILNLIVQPGKQPEPSPAGETYIFIDKSQKWRAEVAGSTLNLVTTQYTSRTDFIDRARRLLGIIATHLEPPSIARLGIRYINRVEDDDTRRWIRTLTVGTQGISIVETAADGGMIHALQDARYLWPDQIALQARWGILPPNALMAPVLAPSPKRSWVLDIDVFREEFREFDPNGLADDLSRYAERAYRFFRWALPAEALQPFRG